MKVDKLSISLPPDLGDAVRASATRRGMPVSGWFALAAAHQLRSEALADAIVLWEDEFGPIPEAALNAARKERAHAQAVKPQNRSAKQPTRPAV